MPEFELLAGILANPTDRELRRVYADWLEDRGDSRGELVRIEEEMASLAPFSDRFWDLKPRRDDLRRTVDAAWLSQMGYDHSYRPLFTKFPRHRKERWRLVELFIECWHGRLRSEDGNSEEEILAAERRLGVRLPLALREWYALAGRRNGIWSGQDRWHELGQLEMSPEEEALVFRTENQGCETWAIRYSDLQQEDPPVYGLVFHNGRHLESPTVTAFAVLTLFMESFSRGPITAAGDVEDAGLLDTIRTTFSKADLPQSYWALSPVHFFESHDIFCVESVSDRFLYVAAKSESVYMQLDVGLRNVLERFDSGGDQSRC